MGVVSDKVGVVLHFVGVVLHIVGVVSRCVHRSLIASPGEK